MIKKRILVTTSCFFSSLALVGCGGKKNIDMQTSDTHLDARWNVLANQIGLPTSDKMPSSNDPEFMKLMSDQLSKIPEKFLPSANEIDHAKYLENRKSVNEYVAKMAQKITATEIISFEKLSVAAKNRKVDYLDYDSVSQKDPSKYALPYLERGDDKTDKKASVNLSNINTPSGLDQDSEFNFYGTEKGDLDKTKITKGTAYVLKYRLADNNIYTAIITIPKDKVKVPLMLYAHGGDTGISFREIATLLQDNLNNYIVAAPAFPGEPICSVDKATGKRDTSFKRYCVDNEGKEIDPAVEAIGEKSPLENDVVATLGLHSALKRISLGELELNNDIIKEFFVGGEKNNPKLEFYVDDSYVKDNKVPSFLNSFKPTLQKIAGPKTVATASSRGGATMLAAIGRSGIMIQQAFEKKDLDFENLIVPPLFSSVATYYAPTSLLMGKFRILFRDVMNGTVPETSQYNALPMITDLMNNQYFSNFRNSDLATNQKELNKLIGFLGASDVTYLAPYISVATQNWTNNLNNILDLKKLIEANPDEFANMIQKTLGTLGSQNIGTDASLVHLSQKIRGIVDLLTMRLTISDKVVSDKSFLQHMIAFSSDHKNNNQCIYIAEFTFSGDCSFFGMIRKGFVNNFDESASLPPLFKSDEEFNKFLEFIQVLVNRDIILDKLMNALEGKKENSISLNEFQLLLEVIEKVTVFMQNGSDILKHLENSLTYVSMNVGKKTSGEPAIPFDEYFKKLDKNEIVAIDQTLTIVSGIKGDLSSLKNKIKLKELIEAPKNYIMAYRKASPGSILLMHNTQDQVVDHTQSVVAKIAFDTVFTMSFGMGAKNFELNFKNIPPVGSQFIAFQPEEKFYTVPLRTKYLEDQSAKCSDEKNDKDVYENSGYNENLKRCFDKRNNLAHNDPAFLTGKVINTHLQMADPSLTNEAMVQAFKYGYDKVNSGTKLSDQLALVNTLSKENKLFLKCNLFQEPSFIKDANCFVFGAEVISSAKENIPLFTKTFKQDVSSLSYKLLSKGKSLNEAMVESEAIFCFGNWSKDAEEHDSMTPTDVMSMWLKTSAKATLTVQK